MKALSPWRFHDECAKLKSISEAKIAELEKSIKQTHMELQNLKMTREQFQRNFIEKQRKYHDELRTREADLEEEGAKRLKQMEGLMLQKREQNEKKGKSTFRKWLAKRGEMRKLDQSFDTQRTSIAREAWVLKKESTKLELEKAMKLDLEFKLKSEEQKATILREREEIRLRKKELNIRILLCASKLIARSVKRGRKKKKSKKRRKKGKRSKKGPKGR